MLGLHAATTATALLLALPFAGCAGGAPTGSTLGAPLLAADAAAHRDPTARPLVGRCETEFDPPPLPPSPVFRQIDTGTCRLAHLGRAAFHSVKDIDLVAGTQVTHEATFTAPNGDVLRARGSGRSTPRAPGRVGFTAELTFVGGTGRFANATGTARVEGEADRSTRTSSLEIAGWIGY
jgi:hypothetical protein